MNWSDVAGLPCPLAPCLAQVFARFSAVVNGSREILAPVSRNLEFDRRNPSNARRRCESARGPQADRRRKLLKSCGRVGSNLGADLHKCLRHRRQTLDKGKNYLRSEKADDTLAPPDSQKGNNFKTFRRVETDKSHKRTIDEECYEPPSGKPPNRVGQTIRSRVHGRLGGLEFNHRQTRRAPITFIR